MAGPLLVTGATGFAGSHLVEHLLQTGARVAGWANPGGVAPAAARDAVIWASVDLMHAGDVHDTLAALRPSAIYHCAGVPDVAESWTAPARSLHVNVIGTHHVLDSLRRSGHTCPVLLVGSALVYRPSHEPITEDHPIGPTSPYGLSKLAQELLGLRQSGTPVFIARPFNHAGPRQKHTFATSSFARQVAEIEAGRCAPVMHVGNLASRRDITDVRDTVRAYASIVERGTAARPYNVCSGKAYKVGDLLEMLIGMARVDVRLIQDPARMRPADNPVIGGDRSRLTKETGWEPAIPIERTLRDLLDYWRTQTTPPARPPT